MIKDPLEIKEQRSVLAEALGALNADQRAALVLVDMEGYSVEEAAVILGCAPGTIKSRCARGRARMAITLGHLRSGSDDTARRDDSHSPRGNHAGVDRVPSGSGAVTPQPSVSDRREQR